MKKINLLIFCTLLTSLVNAREENSPKIFQDVRNGNKEAIKQRLENAEDFTVKDKDGNTVFHIAAQEGQEEIMVTIAEFYNNCSYYNYYISGPTLPKLDEVNNDGDTALHSAIYSDNSDKQHDGQTKVAEYLICKEPQLMKKCNKNNFSPAFVAVKKDDPRFIRIFTAHHGLDLNNHRRNGETIFTYSIKENKPKTIHYCAQKTSLSNVANNDNKTPLSLAIDSENIQLIELLKENLNAYIANTDIKPVHYASAHGKYKALDHMIKNNNISVNEPDKYGNPPIFHAIDSNDEQMMNHLLYLGANLQACNNQGEDALAIATYNKHFNLIATLKQKHNVDINARDKKGQTALMRSSIEQNHDVMETLIGLGANIRITDNLRENILHKIARAGDHKGANLALTYSKQLLSDINIEGNTPLFVAMYNGQFNLAKLLIEAGSPLDTINKTGETILHVITKKGNHPLLVELLKTIKPQFINHKNQNGETAIFFAAKNDDAKSIQYLIERKAEYRAITNIHGLTPMLCAAELDAVEAMKELERQGASLSDCTPEGNTAAHIAAGNGKIKVIRYLQSKNGLLDVYNKKGDNAFSYAAVQGQLEVTKLLLREEYFINGMVSRTINTLKNNLTYNNQDVHNFLVKEHNNRVEKCKEIYNVYVQAKNLIEENKHSAFMLAENNIFHLLTYAPSQVDGEFATTTDALYYMTEAQRTRLFNHYVKAKDKEINQKLSFEKEIAKNKLEQQKALERQKAAEQAEKERIRQQQQAELDRIAQANRQRAAQEQARLQEELKKQQQTEQERIAAQQGTSIAEQQAELDRIAKEKYAKDIEENNKRVAAEEARQRAEEDARGKQARAAERARIEAENARVAQANQPTAAIVAVQGECNICFEDTMVEPVRCTACVVGSARTCDKCIQQHIDTCKANKKPVTCPFCNKATLSEKLKQ